MSYRVFIAKNKKYIIYQVSGEMTRDTAKQFAADIQDLSQKQNKSRFLIDVRQATNLFTIMENFIFIYKDMDEMNFQKNSFTTILINKGDHSHDIVEKISLNA